MLDRLVVELTTALTALGGLTAFVLISVWIRRSTLVGLLLIGAVTLTQWEFTQPSPLATVAGAAIYPNDVLALSLVAVSFRRSNDIGRRLRVVILFVTVVALFSLARGLLSYPLGTAVNESRNVAWVLAALAWTFSIDWSAARHRQALDRSALLIGWGLTAVAGYHVAAYGFGSADTFVVSSTGVEQSSRPLVSGQAIILVLCLLVCIARQRRSDAVSSFAKAAPPAFLVALAASQQRTTWAACAAALLVLFLVGNTRVRVRLTLLALAGGLGALLFLAYGAGSGIAQDLAQSLSNRGTLTGRQNSWTALLDQFWRFGTFEHMFGLPFGFGFGRYEGVGRYVVFAPHNWYVYVVLRTGLIGLTMFGLLLIVPVIRAFVARRAFELSILVAVGVFGYGYSWPWYGMPFFGAAIALSFLPPSTPSDPLTVETARPSSLGDGGLVDSDVFSRSSRR